MGPGACLPACPEFIWDAVLVVSKTTCKRLKERKGGVPSTQKDRESFQHDLGRRDSSDRTKEGGASGEGDMAPGVPSSLQLSSQCFRIWNLMEGDP